jgi:predicted 2-oxoglutarate/Fe(II)-dependent dioxygenase YbiX
MFIVGTYCISFVPGFNETILKGLALSAVIFPPVYWHYNDETKYQFHLNKGD